MLIEIVIIVLASAVLLGALVATWRSKMGFWLVVLIALIGNIAFVATREPSQRSDLLIVWSLFFVGPLVLTVPWLRVAAVTRHHLLLGTVSVGTYFGASVAWVTLAYNTGALTP